MYKNLLALLAASASLAVMLLMSSTAYASPVVAKNFDLAISTPVVRVVNLNLANPTLNLTNQTNNPILHNLGCTCAVCVDASKQLTI